MRMAKNSFVNKQIYTQLKKRVVIAILLIMVVVLPTVWMAGYYAGRAQAGGSTPIFEHPAGSYSYLIWKEGNVYYAKNGETGAIDYSGTDPTTLIQNVENIVDDTGGTIYIKGFQLPDAVMLSSNVLVIEDYQGELHYYIPPHMRVRHVTELLARDSWARVADYPENMTDGSGIVYNGKLHVFGGWGEDVDGQPYRLRTHYSYNFTSNTWTQEADLPYNWTHMVVGVINDKMYVLQGQKWSDSQSATLVEEVWAFDGSSWTMVNNANPLPRMNAIAGVLSFGGTYGIMVVGGGSGTGTNYNQSYVYFPSTNTWTQKADFPIKARAMMAAVYNNKLYVFGGAYGSGPTTIYKNSYVYDPSTDTWTQLADMPAGVYGGPKLTYAIDGKIYIFGGKENQQGVTPRKDLTWRYDTDLDIWTVHHDMPIRRSFGHVGLYNNMYYVAAGSADYRNPLGGTDDTFVYIPIEAFEA